MLDFDPQSNLLNSDCRLKEGLLFGSSGGTGLPSRFAGMLDRVSYSGLLYGERIGPGVVQK